MHVIGPLNHLTECYDLAVLAIQGGLPPPFLPIKAVLFEEEAAPA